jgi:hypothetical protein
MVDSYYQQWQGRKIIRNTENINGVRLKMHTSPGLTPLTGCRFITYNSITIKSFSFFTIQVQED